MSFRDTAMRKNRSKDAEWAGGGGGVNDDDVDFSDLEFLAEVATTQRLQRQEGRDGRGVSICRAQNDERHWPPPTMVRDGPQDDFIDVEAMSVSADEEEKGGQESNGAKGMKDERPEVGEGGGDHNNEDKNDRNEQNGDESMETNGWVSMNSMVERSSTATTVPIEGSSTIIAAPMDDDDDDDDDPSSTATTVPVEEMINPHDAANRNRSGALNDDADIPVPMDVDGDPEEGEEGENGDDMMVDDSDGDDGDDDDDDSDDALASELKIPFLSRRKEKSRKKRYTTGIVASDDSLLASGDPLSALLRRLSTTLLSGNGTSGSGGFDAADVPVPFSRAAKPLQAPLSIEFGSGKRWENTNKTARLYGVDMASFQAAHGDDAASAGASPASILPGSELLLYSVPPGNSLASLDFFTKEARRRLRGKESGAGETVESVEAFEKKKKSKRLFNTRKVFSTKGDVRTFRLHLTNLQGDQMDRRFVFPDESVNSWRNFSLVFPLRPLGDGQVFDADAMRAQGGALMMVLRGGRLSNVLLVRLVRAFGAAPLLPSSGRLVPLTSAAARGAWRSVRRDSVLAMRAVLLGAAHRERTSTDSVPVHGRGRGRGGVTRQTPPSTPYDARPSRAFGCVFRRLFGRPDMGAHGHDVTTSSPLLLDELLSYCSARESSRSLATQAFIGSGVRPYIAAERQRLSKTISTLTLAAAMCRMTFNVNYLLVVETQGARWARDNILRQEPSTPIDMTASRFVEELKNGHCESPAVDVARLQRNMRPMRSALRAMLEDDDDHDHDNGAGGPLSQSSAPLSSSNDIGTGATEERDDRNEAARQATLGLSAAFVADLLGHLVCYARRKHTRASTPDATMFNATQPPVRRVRFAEEHDTAILRAVSTQTIDDYRAQQRSHDVDLSDIVRWMERLAVTPSSTEGGASRVDSPQLGHAHRPQDTACIARFINAFANVFMCAATTLLLMHPPWHHLAEELVWRSMSVDYRANNFIQLSKWLSSNLLQV